MKARRPEKKDDSADSSLKVASIKHGTARYSDFEMGSVGRKPSFSKMVLEQEKVDQSSSLAVKGLQPLEGIRRALESDYSSLPIGNLYPSRICFVTAKGSSKSLHWNVSLRLLPQRKMFYQKDLWEWKDWIHYHELGKGWLREKANLGM